MSKDPLIVLDGARNGASAGALRASVDEFFPDRDVVLLVGVLGDKDDAAIVGELAPRAREAIVTRPPWEERIGDLSHLTEVLGRYLSEVRYIAEIDRAVDAALALTGSGDLLLVTGSIYLVAAVRRILLDSAGRETAKAFSAQTRRELQ